MELYTFIMEYLGGTYISQVKADSNTNAMRTWIKNLLIQEIEGFTEKDLKKLIEYDFCDEEPVLLNELKNTWHFLITTKKGIGFINFVKTKE